MKIDLVKEENKIIVNSLGVATEERVREKIRATEINSGVIREARIERETCRTVENGRIFISQTIKIIMVQLPHKVSISDE